MGEAFLDIAKGELCITSIFILYGRAANEELAVQMAVEVAAAWNEPKGMVRLNGDLYAVYFNISGFYDANITPDKVHANLDPRMNFFRTESFSRLHISFVDEIGCNTGYFLYDNLINQSTTAAHEYGHTLGLPHPFVTDIRGKGQPGIMYPRGTFVDAFFQWDPAVPAGVKGGTLNPAHRKVLPGDIADLHLDKLRFNDQGKAVLGDFTNLYHAPH